MLKRSWFFILPLVAGLLWIGASPSHAAGEVWSVRNIEIVGCNSGNFGFMLRKAGFDADPYVAHAVVTVGGKIYMNEQAPISGNGDHGWNLFNNFSYGVVSNPGSWPIPANQQMKVRFTLERPKGTVLSSWTLVTSGCNSSTIRYSGPTSDDVDEDLVPVLQDACPSLKAFTANGCPVRNRSLTLAAKYGPRRVAGRLFASGYPALHAGRTVYIWKVRPGPDLKVRTRTTNNLGKFVAPVPRGRYYATSPAFISPTAGEVAADRSPTVRVR